MLRRLILPTTKPSQLTSSTSITRTYARMADDDASSSSSRSSSTTPAGDYSNVIHPRRNFFGAPLQPAPVGLGPTTGFFRNNFCDSSPLDPGSHTVAAVLTPEFLKFSAEQGNPLHTLFPLSGPLSPSSSPTSSNPCIWCLCASRWVDALRASVSHPKGEEIVPRVVLESTHERAWRGLQVGREEVERFAVGGDGDGGVGGRVRGGGGENVGR